MKRTVIFFLVFSGALIAAGQTDPEATRVLDKFSATALSASSVSIKFSMVNVNLAENSKDTVKGNLQMLRDQYRLELPDNITWFNGSTSWNYLIREKEVTITKPDRKDDSFFSKPSSLFTMYKKGYKTRLIEDTGSRWIIDLYPEDVSTDLMRIRLTIGKSLNDLISAEYKKKDGVVIYIIVAEYDLKKKPDPGAFTFDIKKYKGVEVVDMR
jgi:outer membrane lipoprotein-sorting protein